MEAKLLHPKDSLYIRTLIWAFERKDAGFTMDELQTAMGVDGSEWEWLRWMFTEGLNGEAPLIHYRHMPSQNYTYFLTASGTAATIDYLELKEAQRSGSRATLIAFIAIAISVIVGVAQVYFDAFYEKPLAGPTQVETMWGGPEEGCFRKPSPTPQ